jgi:plastocyanin
MSRRRLLVLATAVGLTATTVGAGLAFAGPSPSGPIGGGGAISSRGETTFEPNARIESTLRFSPEKAVVQSGQGVRWVHRDADPDPHTVTVIDPADRPSTIQELLGGCRVCGQALEAHFGGRRVDRKIDLDGDGGLSQPGDSLLFFQGGDVSARITAPAGSRLWYLCAIHPWMIGRLVVE